MTELGDFDEQVVHSGGAGGALGGAKNAGAATRSGAACTVCGSRMFENTAFGTWVCVDCGTASQDVRLSTQDIDEGRDLAAMRRTKRRRNDADPVVQLPTAHSAQMNFTKAWMHIIELQTRFVTGHLAPAVASAYTSSVRLLVRRYLRWWAAGERPGVGAGSPPAARHAYPLFLVVNGSLVLPPSTAYCSLLPSGVPPPWAPPISMQLTLGVALLAARLNGLPLTACHLLRAAVQGELSYMAAWSNVPSDLRRNMTFAVSFFTPAVAPRPPTVPGVEGAAAALAAATGVPLPPPNTGGVLQAWLHSCALLTAPLWGRVAALLAQLPEAIPTMGGVAGAAGNVVPGGGGTLPYSAHVAAPEERTDSCVFLAAVFCLAVLSHRDGGRIGAHWQHAARCGSAKSAAALGVSTHNVPADAVCAFRAAPLPLGSWLGVGRARSAAGVGQASSTAPLPPRHETQQHHHVAGVLHRSAALEGAARVALHSGASVPGLAATGAAKARTSNAEKAAFTKWRLYAMQDRMFDAETQGGSGDEGGAGGGDGASTAFSDSTHGASTVGGMSAATGATSVRMTRGSTANKRAGTVQNTLAKRGPSVPQRLLGDLASAAAGLRSTAAELKDAAGRHDSTVAPNVRGHGAQGLGVQDAWRAPLRCGVLFGCVPFDAKRDSNVFLEALGRDERGVLSTVAASVPCAESQLAHCVVCLLHWLAGARNAPAEVQTQT